VDCGTLGPAIEPAPDTLQHMGTARYLAAALSIGAFTVGVPNAALSSGRESREVRARATVIAFFKAFNRHDARAALGFFTTDPRFSRFVGANDCDFSRGRTVAYYRRAGVARWLRERTADHDRLTIRSIRLLGTQPAGAAIAYTRRSSDTLKALGLADGIQPPNETKLGLTTLGPVRFTFFTNAAGNGRPCAP
jgi:hypothetical protein